jgi:hypothetical protein
VAARNVGSLPKPPDRNIIARGLARTSAQARAQAIKVASHAVRQPEGDPPTPSFEVLKAIEAP